MKIRIEPYKTWSGGAKALGQRCGILRATKKQVTKHGDFDIIINWGNTQRRFKGEYLNDPRAVARACDKSESFRLFRECDVPSPPWTTKRGTACAWSEDGHGVVARRLLRANSGRGIVLIAAGNPEEIPTAPLYTRYVKKADEYRVHVFGEEVIDVQQKRKRQEVDNDAVNYQIRNSGNGWVYCRGGVAVPDCAGSAAVSAVAALGLDFGAVDIGYNRHTGEPCVYEVNTAPGLEGSTLDKYYDHLVRLYPQINHGAYRRRREAHDLRI